MDRDKVKVHKDAKREQGQYPAILTELAWSIKDLLHGIKSTEKMIFVLVYFRALKRKLVICKSDNAFWFSCFLVPSRQRNHRKSFYCHGKYFAKENFRTPAWPLAKCYCRNKTGSPEQAVSLHLARLGNQSQRGIWFILLSHGACLIINMISSGNRTEYNSGSNRASDLKLRARLLPELYDMKSYYQLLIVTITKFEKNMTVV